MANARHALHISVDTLATIRRIVPGVTDSAAVGEIVRRYAYLHDDIAALAEAEHLMRFWRKVGAGADLEAKR